MERDDWPPTARAATACSRDANRTCPSNALAGRLIEHLRRARARAISPPARCARNTGGRPMARSSTGSANLERLIAGEAGQKECLVARRREPPLEGDELRNVHDEDHVGAVDRLGRQRRGSVAAQVDAARRRGLHRERMRRPSAPPPRVRRMRPTPTETRQANGREGSRQTGCG